MLTHSVPAARCPDQPSKDRLGRELIEHREDRLRVLPARRLGSVTCYRAEVSVIASVHGLRDSVVRDGILRDVVDA